MFKKAFPWVVFVAAGLMLLLYYLGASSGNCSIIINGEEIGGLRGVACVTGGLLVAGLAVVGALALVALVLAGTSMVLLAVLAVFFLALLFAFSPILAPVVGVVIIVALVVRKRKEKNPPHDEA